MMPLAGPDMCAHTCVHVCVFVCTRVCSHTSVCVHLISSQVRGDPHPAPGPASPTAPAPARTSGHRKTDRLGLSGVPGPRPAPGPQEKPSSHALGAPAQRPAHTSPRPQGLAPAQADGPPVGPGPRVTPWEEQWSPAQGPAWTDARDHGRVCGTALFESAARAPGSRRPPPSPWAAGRGGQRPSSLLRAPGGCRVHWEPRGAQAPWTWPQRHRLPGAPSPALGEPPDERGRGPPGLSYHTEGRGARGSTYREDLVCAGDWGGKGPR